MITGWTQLGQDPWTRCCLYAEDGMKELVPEAWDLLVEDANWFLAHNFLPLNEQERGYHWGSCVSWANAHLCPERGENWLCFSLRKNHSLIYPRQRLNSCRSSELEVDKGYPQNCMGVLPLAHPEPKAWEIQVGLTFSQWGEGQGWSLRNWRDPDLMGRIRPNNRRGPVRIAPPSNSLCLLHLCLLLPCCVDCINLMTSLSFRRILSWV